MNRLALHAFCIAAAVLLGGYAAAADIAVVATVDKTEATLEDYIVLKVTVQGAREEPPVPEMDAFKVQSRGSSSKIQLINGQMSSSVEYTYLLYPQKAGVFSIGPFSLKHRGQAVESNVITVQVLKSTPQARESRDVFVAAEVENQSPYLYEEIIYAFKFYRSVRVANARLTESPAFEGFLTEELGKEKEYKKVINGREYLVTEIRQALFPTTTGVLEISPATLQCDVVVKQRRSRRGFFDDPFFDDSFFGFAETVPKMFRTSPITVMVRPLPAGERPPGFKNLVGDFTLQSELSSRKVEAGESVTLTLTLSGTGNLKNLQDLDMPGVQNFKVYDDKPVFEPQISGGRVGGRLLVKKALVPLVDGTLEIPPVTVSYFSPASGTYKTVAAGPYVLEVLPAQDAEKFKVVEAEGTSGVKQEIKILGHDILPVRTGLEALSPRRFKPLSLLTAVCFLLPIIGYLSTFSAKRLKDRRQGDRSLLRSRQARKNFSKAFPQIRRTLKKDDPQFYPLCAKALKDFIGDKLNVAGSALTARELEARLPLCAVPGETVRAVTEVLDFLDAGRFGFGKHTAAEKEAVLSTMKKLVAALDKKIAKQ